MSVNIKNNALKFIPSEFRNHFINELQLIGDIEVGVVKKHYIQFIHEGEHLIASKDIIKLSPMEFAEKLVGTFSYTENVN